MKGGLSMYYVSCRKFVIFRKTFDKRKNNSAIFWKWKLILFVPNAFQIYLVGIGLIDSNFMKDFVIDLNR